MKKYLLLAGCIAILATGCGNKNTAQKQITVNNEVKVIAGEEQDWSTSSDLVSSGTLSGTAGQVVSSGGERWTSRTNRINRKERKGFPRRRLDFWGNA